MTNEKDLRLAHEIVNSFDTQQALADICGRTQPAVAQWLKRGIPKPWLMFLRERYPTLKAWQIADAANAKDLPN